MQTQASVYQIPLEDLVEQILFSRKITRTEESRLVSALSQAALAEEQRALIHRVLYGLRHDLLQIVDWVKPRREWLRLQLCSSSHATRVAVLLESDAKLAWRVAIFQNLAAEVERSFIPYRYPDATDELQLNIGTSRQNVFSLYL